MFRAITISPDQSDFSRYRIERNDQPLTYSNVLDLWSDDAVFRSYFSALLAESPFPAFRWETPALTRETASQPFEFVLLNAAGFDSRTPDGRTFQEYFTTDDSNLGVVAFSSLGGDATMVVPSPRTSSDAYGHLAAFLRRAPDAQVDALWRIVAATVKPRISSRLIWLSTAGGGVAWLHVRIDSRPKYYGYEPYKQLV